MKEELMMQAVNAGIFNPHPFNACPKGHRWGKWLDSQEDMKGKLRYRTCLSCEAEQTVWNKKLSKTATEDRLRRRRVIWKLKKEGKWQPKRK